MIPFLRSRAIQPPVLSRFGRRDFKMKRTIMHLDMDSFFAAVEQQANPLLRGQPVGIIKQEGRTCVIAASIEAKKFGVKTGTSVWEAKKLCPKIFLVPANFDKYFSVTQRFIEICKMFSPCVEVFSIDEAFLEVTESQKFFGGPFFMALKIKQLINEEIGGWLTCSIGVSYNKLLAKLASEQNKPDGYLEINKLNRDNILSRIEPTDICGIGYRLAPRLFNAGITNLIQIRSISDDNLRSTFGPHWSVELKRLAWGIDDSPVIPSLELPEMKSVSRTFTLFADTRDERKIRQTIRNLSEEAAKKIRDMKMMARQVGLGIRGNDKGIYGRRTLKYYLDDGKEIFDLAWKIYQQFSWSFSVRFVGIWLGLLQKRKYLPADLFPWKQKKAQLWQAVDKANHRFGDFTVYPAVLLGGDPSTALRISNPSTEIQGFKLIRPEVNGFLGDKKYQL